VSIATPEGADLTALPVEVLTDEELAILAGPGGLVVAPYLGSLDDADREAVLRTAYRGLLARGVVNPPSPRALAAAVGEPSVELQVRRDVLSLMTLRRAARVVVAIGRTTVATQDYWYAHVVDDVVVVEQVGSDGMHRFALASTDQLADLVIGAAVHPECGDSAGLALELPSDASEPPLEIAQVLGAALLRTDVVVRHAADRNPPLIGLFTGPGGAWMVRAQESAGGPLLARPLARVELEHELRVAVHDAVAAVGSMQTRS